MKVKLIILLALLPLAYAQKPPDWNEPATIKNILTVQGDRAGLPIGLAHCVAYTESRFIPTARSRVVNNYRSCGIMQIYRMYIVSLVNKYSSHPATFDWTNPRDNAEVGCKYLAFLIDRFGVSVWLGLVAYRWGPTNLANITQESDIPDYAVWYADSILKMLDEYDESW
jgi:soluble lytic murein transglycosylase-like protein